MEDLQLCSEITHSGPCLAAGLKGIVNNSQWCADLLSPSPVSHRHALSEEIFDAFPTPTVHLRGAMYYSNISLQLGRSAAASGTIRWAGCGLCNQQF